MPVKYIYGRPVKGDEFVGRENELSTIFQRLLNGESSAVVGAPHIGKTSLLLQIANPLVQKNYLGEKNGFIYSFIDLHPIGTSFTPQDFWDNAIEPLGEKPGSKRVSQFIESARKEKYSIRSLEKLFGALAEEGRTLVLLMDEFDHLLYHSNFRDPSFFASLRSLSTRVGGICKVTATRFTVAEMDERGRGLLDIGSPFFNNMIQISLNPFDDKEIQKLFSHGQSNFTVPEKKFIYSIAGRHPYLLQAFAGTYQELKGNKSAIEIAEIFYDRIYFHFDDLWHSMNDKTRTTAVILGLVELRGRALGQEYSYGEIERVEAFGPELRRLKLLGLANRAGVGTQFDKRSFLLWQGERWVIGNQAFVWWIRDVVIAETRKLDSYGEWLAKKRYNLLLTEEMWNSLYSKVRSLPDWAVRGVGSLARAVIEEILRK